MNKYCGRDKGGCCMEYTIISGCDANNPLHVEVIKKISTIMDENKIGITSQWFDLKEHKLYYCRGCDYCQTVNPGICVIKDMQNEILKQYICSDIVIVITPINFGCCNYPVKNFIERTQPLFLSYQIAKNGHSVMKARYEKYPELIFIGIQEKEENDSAKFIEFIEKCNLAEASKRVQVKVVTKQTDVDSLSDYIVKER
jgi:multimeric flavodoxin WrbA